MRYQETGEVHLDFHRTTNGTLAYLREHYGEELLDEVYRHTAQDVYRAIHEELQRGDPEQWLAHSTYFLDREQGEYSVARESDGLCLTVTRCPAIAYLESRGLPVDPAFCRQTVVMNQAWSEGTPFVIETEVQGGGRCVQRLRRRTDDSQ